MIDLTTRIDRCIARQGQFVMHVLDDPAWSYTVGNAELGLPELYVQGLDAHTGHALLNVAGEQMRVEPASFVHAATIERVASMPLRLDDMPHALASSLLLGARARMRRIDRDPDSIAALQLVWPDPAGVMPGQPGHDVRFAALQNAALIHSSRRALDS